MVVDVTLWHDIGNVARCNFLSLFWSHQDSHCNNQGFATITTTMITHASNLQHTVGMIRPRTGTGARSRPLITWLGVAAICASSFAPLAPAQSPSDDTATGGIVAVSAQPHESPQLDWIPAITIRASDIDLLLQEQATNPIRRAAGTGFPAAMLVTGNHAGGPGRSASPTQPGQLILRLLPDQSVTADDRFNSSSYSWALLGGSTSAPANLVMRPARTADYTSLSGADTGTPLVTGLLRQHTDSFAPQLNLGWQFGSLGAAIAEPPDSTSNNIALASIQCAQSVLTSSSYTASGCHFTRINQQQLLLGLDWTPLPGLSTTAAFFESSQSSRPGWEHYAAGTGTLAAAGFGKASMADVLAESGQQLKGMQIGLQLELFSGNNNIDISAGWSRIIDFQLDSAFGLSGDPAQTSALHSLGLGGLSAVNAFNQGGAYVSNETLDAATLQINWSNGTFSSGLESVYQQTPLLPGLRGADELTTFNLHFTWHTPWRGALSVGADNLLDSTGNGAPELTGEDAINSIYGRIPYVRYKQDL